MKEKVIQALINLHKKTGKEWISLKEIYQEVENMTGKPNANKGASIRAMLETHSRKSEAFRGQELFVMKEKGLGLYKYLFYDNIEFINNMKIGDIYTRDQLMQAFKISGQAGMMKTNTLNALILITSEESVYKDSIIENSTIQYTGEGLVGDQTITKNNKTLFYSKENNIPVYLFSKDNKRRYVFEGKVELYSNPYQVAEKDINNIERKVWKFPLKIISQNENMNDPKIKEISNKVKEIENKYFLEEQIAQNEIKYIAGLLNIRKYRKTGKHNQRLNKPDFIAQEIIKSKQGEINENDIFEFEIKQLIKEEAHKQIKLMKEFFANKKENEGFDILSFEKNKQGQYIEKYIEVKSTKGDESTPIDITIDEIEFAKSHMESYYLYRIVNSTSNSRYLKIVKGKELLKNYDFIPVTFKIYSK